MIFLTMSPIDFSTVEPGNTCTVQIQWDASAATYTVEDPVAIPGTGWTGSLADVNGYTGTEDRTLNALNLSGDKLFSFNSTPVITANPVE
jgi:hypothetical protein